MQVDERNVKHAAPADLHGRDGEPVNAPPTYAVATQDGVRKAEALQNPRVWGSTSKLILFFGVALMAYTYSLDGVTTYQYQSFVTSQFLGHSLLGAVASVSAIVIAVGKPVAAKFADVLGRAESWIVAITLYTIGYIILAACTSVESYAAGWIIRSAGYAAVQILMQIIIGDVTSLRYRTFFSSLVSLPYFINGFVGARIGAAITGPVGNTADDWRWGFGMFCIIFPAVAIPIVGILAWSQIKAYRLGVVHTTNPWEETQLRVVTEKAPFLNRVVVFLDQMDFVGLLLFTAGWTCLLLPLTLANGLTLPWSSGKIIAMLTIGPIILIGFVVYEGKFARYPFIPARFVTNRTVLCAALIGFFDFISFYLQFTYQYSFIYVVKDWSQADQNYFGQTQTLALTLFAIIAGAIVLVLRRYKWLLMAGVLIRLFGVGLMIHSKGARGTTAELVIVQIIQGWGGGFAAVLAQTAAQGSVPHQDLAAVTAFVLIFAEIGNAIGSAIASAIWRNVMPGRLATELNGLANQTTIDTIYGSITTLATYPFDDPIRIRAIEAYTFTMRDLLIAATVVAIVPPILVLFMKDIKLGDQQNDVERRQVDGESVHSSIDDEKK